MKKWSLLLIGLAFFGCGRGQTHRGEWLFIYYMPYDNNLTYFGNEIIRMIKDSLQSPEITAVIQGDFNGDQDAKRFIITRDSVQEISVAGEYAAFTKTYENYLAWVKSAFDFKKTAIVFLDHGGRLNELGLDEFPVKGFLKVDSLARVFRRVNGNRKADLLFLQVCTKGSIEPLYELREVAPVTLCSQTELGAPNYYYPEVFGQLSRHPGMNTAELVQSIMENDTYNMYSSYTCIDNSKLGIFYSRFAGLIGKLKQQGKLTLSAEPLSVTYYGEKYWDLAAFLNRIESKDSALLRAKNDLQDFLNNQLISRYKLNPVSGKMQGYCGLSMFALTNKTRYPQLAFYRLYLNLPKFQVPGKP